MGLSIDRLAAALADRYRIGRELGEGGMATVYLADDVKHRRKVAIKALRPEPSAVIGAEYTSANPKPVATLKDVADRVDCVRKTAGVDHVGIGSDSWGDPGCRKDSRTLRGFRICLQN